MIEQLIIAITGPLSIWWVNDPRRSYRRLACVIALVGQPAWLYAAYIAEQWGILPVELLYLAAWVKGFHQQWFKGEQNG